MSGERFLIHNWDDIKDRGWNNLLLGNGFSINIWGNYSYSSLYKYSIDNKVEPILTEIIQNIFSELKTINFEEVLKALAYAILVKKSIGEQTDDYLSLYETVKKNLFNTVHAVHVEYSKLNRTEIAKEINHFKKVFTTCYDLILYWSSYGSLSTSTIADFFWNSNTSFDPQNIDTTKLSFYYLHGALHIKQDLKGTVSKLLYTANSLPSSDEFQYKGNMTELPLYISEGTSEEKLNKIKSNNYLTFCYQSFSNISGTLLVVGHSLNENFDNHLVKAITDNEELKTVAISIYSGLTEEVKQKSVKELEGRLYREGLELCFFESNS